MTTTNHSPEPFLVLTNTSGRTRREFTEAECAIFGREALKTLAGPEPWDSDTLQELGDFANMRMGFDFDIFLDENDDGLDEDGNVIAETDDEPDELDEDEPMTFAVGQILDDEALLEQLPFGTVLLGLAHDSGVFQIMDTEDEDAENPYRYAGTEQSFHQAKTVLLHTKAVKILALPDA